MKVEIRFRVWDKVNRRMTFGGSFHTLEIDGKLQEWFGMPTPHPDDCELMQYTGLKDSNGVEIYEGDIVKIGDMLRQIIFVDAKFQITGIDKMHNANYDLQPSEELEVIGNIWQNPELLKVEKK